MKKELLKKKLFLIFKKHNLKNSFSNICANAIINAELVGAPSHGLSRLKMYCDRINKKVINPKGEIVINKVTNSISIVNANNNIGFVAADFAIKQAITNAKKTGIGFVGVKNSGHYGLSSYYLEQAVKKKLIAFCFTNAPPAVAPYGSKKKLFGTNPIAFASPAHNNIPFIFDSSISKINRGKIRLAARLNKKIGKGVALDKKGNVTTNPNKALEGVQLPIGEFRGSGLAWMIDILCGVFTGAGHSGSVKDPFNDFSGPQNVGHLFLVFKSNLFVNNYSKRIKENIKRVKNQPKLKGVKEILYPGQKKYQRYKKNLKKDILVTDKIMKEIDILLGK